MIFNTIILVLGLQVIFMDDANVYCNWPGFDMGGCYANGSKTIIVGYNSDDVDQTFYHEIGHAITADDHLGDEGMAKLFVEYVVNPNFKYKYPEINTYFNNKINNYEKIYEKQKS